VPPDLPVADALHRALKDLTDAELAVRVARDCRAWGACFDWDATGARFAAVLERHLAEGGQPGWLPGMPEATVAEHVPGGPLLVEQRAPADVLTELRAAGSRHAEVRAASATERLLGRAIPADTPARPHARP
jgi:hypothetical protein